MMIFLVYIRYWVDNYGKGVSVRPVDPMKGLDPIPDFRDVRVFLSAQVRSGLACARFVRNTSYDILEGGVRLFGWAMYLPDKLIIKPVFGAIEGFLVSKAYYSDGEE